MNTNDKNRKLLWVGGAVLAVLYVAPQALQSFRQTAFYREQMQAANARAHNGRGASATTGAAPAASGSANIPALAANPSLGAFTGVWQGQQAQANHEVCQLAVEMRENVPGRLTGYPRLVCYPLPSYYPGQPKVNPGTAFLKSMSPISAVLTGSLKDGAVVFHVDKTIGETAEGCALTAFTVTPFGNDQAAAEWQNGRCGNGQMVLR